MKKCLEYPNKKRYSTQREAETVILLIGNNNIRCYKCDTCGNWHLTSKN